MTDGEPAVTLQPKTYNIQWNSGIYALMLKWRRSASVPYIPVPDVKT
jgi:hypothetical protein